MQRIIIDTDPGVDDAVAIWLALASPELDVLGITTVAGNVPLADVCQNAGRIIALADRDDVPLFAGAEGPIVGPQKFGKYAHIGAFSRQIAGDVGIEIQQQHAVSFIVEQAILAAKRRQPITICAIGPLTNIALALIHSPEVADGIEKIVLMGGAFTALGHRTPWAEFNLYADPHAAARVFSSAIPLVIMPLDVTFQVLLTTQHLATLAELGGEPGQAVARMFTAFDRSDRGRLQREGGPVHDAMVIAYLLAPHLFSGVKVRVGIETQGETQGYCWADFYHKLGLAPNATVMRQVDEQKFHDLLHQVFSRYGNGLRPKGE